MCVCVQEPRKLANCYVERKMISKTCGKSRMVRKPFWILLGVNSAKPNLAHKLKKCKKSSNMDAANGMMGAAIAPMAAAACAPGTAKALPTNVANMITQHGGKQHESVLADLNWGDLHAHATCTMKTPQNHVRKDTKKRQNLRTSLTIRQPLGILTRNHLPLRKYTCGRARNNWYT